MHEVERDAALQVVKDPHPTDSFVMGTLDDAQIKGLEDRGLVVQVLAESRRPAFERAAAPADAPLAAGAPVTIGPLRGDEITVEGGGGFDVLDAQPIPGPVGFGPPVGLAPAQTSYFVVSIDGPLLEDWRAQLVATGAQLGERVAGSSYIVAATASQANDLRGLDFVTGLETYGS